MVFIKQGIELALYAYFYNEMVDLYHTLIKLA